MTLAGTPPSVAFPSGKLFTTTALAPITVLGPMTIGPNILAPVPMKQLSPMQGASFLAPALVLRNGEMSG